MLVDSTRKVSKPVQGIHFSETTLSTPTREILMIGYRSDMHLTKEVQERSRQILIRLGFVRAHFEGPIDSIQSTAFQSRLAKAR